MRMVVVGLWRAGGWKMPAENKNIVLKRSHKVLEQGERGKSIRVENLELESALHPPVALMTQNRLPYVGFAPPHTLRLVPGSRK